MSRIDELQRLHEAATKNSNLPWIWVDRDRAWPAILRVLVAARAFDASAAEHGLVTIAALRELSEALRALDGGA